MSPTAAFAELALPVTMDSGSVEAALLCDAARLVGFRTVGLEVLSDLRAGMTLYCTSDVSAAKRIATYALGDSLTYRLCIELFRYVIARRLCRINRGHSAAMGSLSGRLQLVIWSWPGVIVPADTVAAVGYCCLSLCTPVVVSWPGILVGSASSDLDPVLVHYSASDAASAHRCNLVPSTPISKTYFRGSRLFCDLLHYDSQKQTHLIEYLFIKTAKR